MTEPQFTTGYKSASLTLAALDAAVLARADSGFRPHLGASLIGKRCQRALWYSFRWSSPAKFSARMLRLFARGQREEEPMGQYLKAAGVRLHQADPHTGAQFAFSDCEGHFGGSMDGAAHNVPDAPKVWHVWENKTSGKKAFDTLARQGVRAAKPEHWAQMQCYMHWSGMTRALYTAVCKDNDEIHMERVEYDAQAAAAFVAKAQSVIDAPLPPERIGNADWYECKWCEHFEICHGTSAPAVNCRTCAHSTPVKDAAWSCALKSQPRTLAEQKVGCDEHRFIPQTLPWAEVTDANHAQNWVQYRHSATGWEFANGAPPAGFLSREIYASANKAGITMVANDPELMKLRQQFGAEIVK